MAFKNIPILSPFLIAAAAISANAISLMPKLTTLNKNDLATLARG